MVQFRDRFKKFLGRCLFENVACRPRGEGAEDSIVILEDGQLQSNGYIGSIHRVGAHLKNAPACNGWAHWYYDDEGSGQRQPIDVLRERFRQSPPENEVEVA